MTREELEKKLEKLISCKRNEHSLRGDCIAEYQFMRLIDAYTQAKVLEARIDEQRLLADVTERALNAYEPILSKGVSFMENVNSFQRSRLDTLQAELEDGLTPRERMEKFEAERSKL